MIVTVGRIAMTLKHGHTVIVLAAVTLDTPAA
jgi:hypothetical protein